MVLPIPCNEKPFKLKVLLHAERPVEIVLMGYDADRQNSVYFSRKVNFYPMHMSLGLNEVEISLGLPLAPKNLVVKIHNAYTGDDRGFSAENITVDRLENKLWADAEMQRFISYASDFVKKMGTYPPGFYPSVGGEFLIELLPVIRDENEGELITPARVNRGTGRKQLSMEAMRPLSIPIRMFILLHERKHFTLPTRSEKRADLAGLKHFLDMGFPKIEAVYAATKVFDMHPENVGPNHERRVRDIMNFIDEYKFREKQVVRRR